MENTTIKTCFKHDRAHVALQYRWGVKIIEWWGDEVREAVEEGVLDPTDYHGSARAYASERGVMCSDERILTLAEHLKIAPDELTEGRRGTYTHGTAEYLVLTDDEADQALDEELERYIEECMEIPEHLYAYFDREAWKRDARLDGRGRILGGYYDGCEYEVGDYFIYRIQ